MALLAGAAQLAAQAVIAPPPSAYSASAVKDAQSGNPPPKRLSNLASALGAGGPLFQRGYFAVRPRILYRLLYADGLLNAEQTESGNSLIQTITVGCEFTLGQHWAINYTITKVYNSNQYIGDTTDHSLVLSGGWVYGDLRMGISQSYSSDSPILVETAAQTKQHTYGTNAFASYRFGARTALSLSVAHSTRLASASASAPEWTTSDWRSLSGSANFSYFFSSRLQASIGISGGRDYVSRGSDMTSLQPNVHLTWQPTEKLSFGAGVGFEKRRILDGTSEAIEGPPLYSVNGHYQPTPTTGFSVNANRSTSASYFANQAIRSTGIGFAYEQRLLGRYFWTTDFSRSQTEYLATNLFSATGRIDRGTILGTRISTVLLGRLSVSVFFQRGTNSSSRSGFDVNGRQVGGEVGYHF